MKSDTDEEMEIINIKTSPDEKLLAILCGKNLIKAIEEMHMLFVYELSENEDDFKMLYRIELPEEFRYFSKAFCFNTLK